ncbi:MAG: small multi-drug export protein, partial [Candidatus Omnitrophica bacterium]|nr:small multi-drug export protein [Candidatus Omnitrophota bacterium]
MEEVLKIIIESLKYLPKELIVLIISALPIFELRLGVPVAVFVFNFSYPKALFFSILGNVIPVVPILILLKPISSYLVRFKIWKKFFDWFFNRTQKRADIVQRYEALGLMLFVSIPLPVTGIWTGCVAASIFKIKFRYAFFACVCGAIIAGIVVS